VINDIDEVVASKILKFADDTKLYGVVANQQDVERLKNDLKNLCNWSADRLMLFNVDKCKVMHFGYNNSKSTYGMNGKDLEEISEERDLGMIVQQDLKWSKQCSKSVSTANRILGMIKRSFCYLSKDVLLKLLMAKTQGFYKIVRASAVTHRKLQISKVVTPPIPD
jgi:ribonuclease P/MRP protein subunit RPP40